MLQESVRASKADTLRPTGHYGDFSDKVRDLVE